MQIAAGNDYATVSKALGHATVAFTLDTYTHPDAKMAAPLADAAEAALGTSLQGRPPCIGTWLRRTNG